MATILIVDDDAAMREGLAETVVDLGHRACLAASGKEALALVAEGSVDAVLLDLRMPGELDGIEVLRRIKARDNAPPVAVLTAFASADNTIEAMRLGAFDHLTKPIGRDDLKSLLLGMLAQHGPTASGPSQWWRSSPWSRWPSSHRGLPRPGDTGSLVLALVALPVRGVIAANVATSWGILPVQILDGVGAGMLGVATPGLVARILAGSGHVNAGLGAVMTFQAVGAASSPALAGLMAQQLGYSAAFLALGGIAAIALALWLVATPVVGPACRNHLAAGGAAITQAAA